MLTNKIKQANRLLILVALVGLWGCNSLDLGALGLQFPGNVKSVQDLQSEPAIGSTVYLRGQVGDRVPLVEAQVYQLQDETGSIWVVTSNPLTQSGDRIAVQGSIRFESIPLAGQEMGEVYIEEQNRWIEAEE